MANLKDFFEKHPLEFSEMIAVKLMHKTIECAEKELKENKTGKEHLKYLAKAHEMLEDYFNELEINPESLL